jgi:hypothetical protein
MTATLDLPPVCNTGASDLTWDWYQATLKGVSSGLTSVNGVLSVLGAVLGHGSQWEPTKALYGYPAGVELLGVPVGSVKVFYGADDVHVQATSSVAEPVADLLRQWWPDHTVSRADVAFDVIEPGSFDRLYQRVHTLARTNPRGKVSTSTAGDWLDRESGRTFYAGGTSSRLRVVVYEKGHEQRAKDPNCGADLDWTRVEWRLRPTSDQKAWLARASKVEALGLSAFGVLVAEDVLVADVIGVGNLLRFASQDPAYWMAKQYRRVVLALLELDPDDIRARLVQLVEQTDPERV